jgi:uncharacterized protein
MTIAVLSPPHAEDDMGKRFDAADPGAWLPAAGRAASYAKVVIAGGFGVGKTTFVATASEIPATTTEVVLSSTGIDTRELAVVPRKVTTTAAMDVGRLSIAPDVVLVLFGTCGQARFWSTFLAVCRGAAGAVVLVDTRRLADCFPYLDLFERDRMPFVVAVNEFDRGHRAPPAAVREALAIGPGVPLVVCDARNPTATRQVLTVAAEHLLRRRPFTDPPVR